MKAIKGFFILLLAWMALPGYAAAGDAIAVIVNIKNPITTITQTDLRKIYDDLKLKWENGMPITVYDLDVNDPLREAFSQQIFSVSSDKRAEMWAHLKITNQAKNPPMCIKNEYLIMKMISVEEWAIGYVSLSAAKSGDVLGYKIVATIY